MGDARVKIGGTQSAIRRYIRRRTRTDDAAKRRLLYEGRARSLRFTSRELRQAGRGWRVSTREERRIVLFLCLGRSTVETGRKTKWAKPTLIKKSLAETKAGTGTHNDGLLELQS